MKSLIQMVEVGCFLLAIPVAIFSPQYALLLIGAAIWLNLANK